MPSGGARRLRARVHEHEARPCRRSPSPGRREARLSEQRGLLVAGDARDRARARRAARPRRDRRSTGRRRGRTARGRRRARAARRPTRASSRSSSIVRDAFVTSVRCAPPRQLPDEPGVDRPERELAGGAGARRAATRASSPRSTGRGRARCARGSARPAARRSARPSAGPARRSRVRAGGRRAGPRGASSRAGS